MADTKNDQKKKKEKKAEKASKEVTKVDRPEGLFTKFKKMFKRKEITPEQRVMNEICNRQRILEFFEIKEEWKVVIGEDPPSKKKDILHIKGVTLRKIWMEPLFLYEEIIKLHTESLQAKKEQALRLRKLERMKIRKQREIENAKKEKERIRKQKENRRKKQKEDEAKAAIEEVSSSSSTVAVSAAVDTPVAEDGKMGTDESTNMTASGGGMKIADTQSSIGETKDGGKEEEKAGKDEEKEDSHEKRPPSRKQLASAAQNHSDDDVDDDVDDDEFFECYHPANKYHLQWTPPGSAFKIAIPLTDRALQEAALRKYSKIDPAQKAFITFHMIPANPVDGLFAEKVHPSSLVSYRTRNEVLGKLCEYFLEGKIENDELNEIMASNYDAWKKALYNYLPADEQVFHQYLSHITEKVITKSKESQYLDEEITLEEYEDLKFPDRARKKELERAGYPQPYVYGTCRICRAPDGVIKCNTCDNLVCTACIHKHFLHPETAIGSYLLMHRIFCMKFGKVPPVTVSTIQEPMFVRSLRMYGREAAMEEFQKALDAMKEKDEEPEVVVEEYEDEETLDERMKRLAEEAKQDTEDVKEIKLDIKFFMKKYEKEKKNILASQEKVEDMGRSEPYREREEREKQKAIIKFQKMKIKIEELKDEVNELEANPNLYPDGDKVYPPTKQQMLNDLNYLLVEIDMISTIESITQYEAACVEKRKEIDGDNQGRAMSTEQLNAQLLMQFSTNSS